VESDLPNDTHRLIDHNPRENGGTDDVIVELKLVDGKVWIVRDGISYGITEDLLDVGIPPEDIMMDFEKDESFALMEAGAA
jgi:hypothetical protein